METIKLPKTDLADMRAFYQEELDKTVKRLQHIKSVLDKLGGNGSSLHIEITAPNRKKTQTGKSNGQENASGVAAPAKTRQKPGPKSVWETMILKRMRQVNRPLTYDELLDEIMTFSKLPESKRKNTRQAIANVIFRLRNRDKKIATLSTGTRKKYIALKSWFSKPGELKKEYAGKIKKAEPKPKRTVKRKAKRIASAPKP